MTETVYVKPAEGGRVRMPDRGSQVMPATGMRVQRTDYYERLILSQDLVIVPDPKEPERQHAGGGRSGPQVPAAGQADVRIAPPKAEAPAAAASSETKPEPTPPRRDRK